MPVLEPRPVEGSYEMKYGTEQVALCTRGSCNHGPSRHKGIAHGDNDYRGAQEVGECRDCDCVGYDPKWEDEHPKEVLENYKYPSYAKISIDGDYLYRSDYVHHEDEEIPEEFYETPLSEVYLKHQWGRELYEVRMDMKYNMRVGTVELVAVDGVPLTKPLKLR